MGIKTFEVGDRVKIIDGADEGLYGEVASVSLIEESCRVNVVVPGMGREEKTRTYLFDDLVRVDATDTAYSRRIKNIIDRQVEKGIVKYGVTLEENVTLTTEQRIEHLQEELADAMMYCESLKDALGGNSLTADDYQRAALRTARVDELSKDELLLNGVMGLCGEAGECIDLVKKARFQGHELVKKDLMEEISDVLWYAAVASYALDLPLSEVMQANIDKLKERYPEKFDKARSIHREG